MASLVDPQSLFLVSCLFISYTQMTTSKHIYQKASILLLIVVNLREDQSKMDATMGYLSCPYLSNVNASETSKPAILSREMLLTQHSKVSPPALKFH